MSWLALLALSSQRPTRYLLLYVLICEVCGFIIEQASDVFFWFRKSGCVVEADAPPSRKCRLAQTVLCRVDLPSFALHRLYLLHWPGSLAGGDPLPETAQWTWHQK